MKQLILSVFCFTIAINLISCTTPESKEESTIVVAVSTLPTTINPLMVRTPIDREIVLLVYPGLFYPEENPKTGQTEYQKSIGVWRETFNNEVMVRISAMAKWSDDIPVSVRDVIYTYSLYGSGSTVWRNELNGLPVLENGGIDIGRAIEVIDDSTLNFKFIDASSVSLNALCVPIVPRHQYEALPPVQLQARVPVKTPTVAGSFTVESVKENEIVLHSNENTLWPPPAKTSRIVFRYFHNARQRVDSLLEQKADIVSNISSKDISDVQQREEFDVLQFPPLRLYVIGWNNIDFDTYDPTGEGKIRTNRYFGNPEIRKALTSAIDRDEILNRILGPQVTKAIGPISPKFRDAVHDTLHQLPLDELKAQKVLNRDGWTDILKTGSLEKFGKPFAFDMLVLENDGIAVKLASEVKSSLKKIGIDVNVSPVSSEVYKSSLTSKHFDAFLGALEMPDRLELLPHFDMDLINAPLNYVSYRNKRATDILSEIKSGTIERNPRALWNEFQEILQEQQPYTFLFWESTFLAKNKSIQGTHFTQEKLTTRVWEWYIKKTNY